jgi:hypothetical protein
MTKLPCALLAVPPHAKFNHTNPSELQSQFLESPGPNHSDLWRVTSFRSNLWILQILHFVDLYESLFVTLHSALPCGSWDDSVSETVVVQFPLLFVAPFFMFLFSCLIPRPISSPSFQLHFYHRPFFFHQPLFLPHLHVLWNYAVKNGFVNSSQCSKWILLVF